MTIQRAKLTLWSLKLSVQVYLVYVVQLVVSQVLKEALPSYCITVHIVAGAHYC